MPAPLKALEAIKVGMNRGIEAGLAYEREAIGWLATTPACRNLVTLFFLIENARKGPVTADQPAIRRVGIVGAGTMGAGIAQLAAINGFDIVIQEVNETALAAGVKKVEELFHKAVQRGLLSAENMRKKLSDLGKTTSWEGFGDVDLVVEAVLEDMGLKKKVFQELERHTRADTILATNTSSLSVREIQEGLTHPERVGGLHFFNPVHKMPLVEVVETPVTGAGIGTILARWAADLGKIPVQVKDGPGFVVNRILMPYLYEAVILAAEKVPLERIDYIMRRFGMPMGPFELMDQVGLDVGAHIARTMQPFVAKRFPPNETFERMTQRGWLGQKSGTGFYRYEGKKKQINPDLESSQIFTEVAAKTSSDSGTIRDRMVLLMVNEAAACLGEGLAASAEVIDLAMVLGTGWAPHRGGPLRYAEDQGLTAMVKSLESLARRVGTRFEPCAELRRRVESGGKFYTVSAANLQAGKI
jgi:3-hydroxyacyl-CoA dehydrogenase/enoyl-CoA hydratase/3-hydroxybutyryl-CoA epimerase